MVSLETVASSLGIDVEILKQVYQNGYSNGFDDGVAYSKETKEEFDNLEMFNVERHKGQKE